jgi:hypothetical protein
MGHAYLTEKQMPWSYWFYAITHNACMMNAFPGKHSGHLASPFLLVHGVGHDKCTWIPLFSLCYFHHVRNGNQKRSKHQAHTMDGIVIGRSPTSNALLVYNPRNKQYYELDSYCLDSYCLLTSIYPDAKYNGGLFCSLVCDNNPTMEEKYPTGTRVEQMNPSTHMLLAGTVMDIPILIDDSASTCPPPDRPYSILFDNGTTALIPLSEMAGLIPPPPVTSSLEISSNSTESLLPPFLCLNSRITYKHDGQYHKGFLGRHDGIYCFVFKSHVNKRKEDWGG